MSSAFGISEDDVFSVLLSKEIRLEDHIVSQLFDDLDADAVAEAAMDSGDDMDEQTMGAYEEIWTQLQDMDPVKAWLAKNRAETLEETLPPSRPAPGPRL
jgi:hypothetical protein